MDVSVEKQFKEKKSRIFLYSGIVLFLIILLVTFGYLNIAKAATSPSIITYQGKLLNNGVAVTTTQDIKYILYDDPTAGTALYSAAGTTSSPSAVSTTVSDGFFTVDLGDTGTNSIDPAIFKNNSAVYLKVIVGSETLSPRKRITASPYSLNSKYLDGVAATATPQSSTYIPISDSSGNFNFNSVTSTALNVSGNTTLTTATISNLTSLNSSFTNVTTTGSFWTNFLTAATGWFTNIFWTDATSTGNTNLNTLTATGNTTLATTTISSSTVGYLNVTNNTAVGGLLSVIGNSYFGSIASGTWNGSLISNAKGGTGQDSSGWTGFTKITGGVWATSTIGVSDLTNSSTLAYLSNNQTFTGQNIFTATTTFASTSFNGFVGVGTTTPQAKLHVYGGTLLVDNPINSSIVGSIVSSTAMPNPVGLQIIGKYAYVIGSTGGNGNLTILNLSNPISPTIISTLSSTTLNGAYDIKLSGNYSFINTPTSLVVVDISNAHSPIIVSILNGISGAGQFAISGKYAFIPNWSEMVVVDISNPTLPFVISSTTVALSQYHGVVIKGRYMYLSYDSGFKVYDILNPYNLVFKGSGIYSNFNDHMDISGQYIYTLSGAGVNVDTLSIYDISNPDETPVLPVGSTTDSNIGAFKYLKGIKVSGNYAYLSGGDYFVVVDITDKSNPRIIQEIYDPQLANSKGLELSGKYAYVLRTGDGLYVIDLQGADISSANIGNIGTDRLTVWNNAEVGNNLYVSNGLNVGMGGLLSSGAIAVAVSSTVGTSTVFSVGTTAANLLTINGNGYVGIGTSSPSYKLDVNGDVNLSGILRINGNDYSQYFISSSGTAGQVWQSDGVGTGDWVNTSSLGILPSGTTGQSLFYGASSWEATSTLFLNSNGNIGIGTTTPSEKLHLNGGNFIQTAYGNPTVKGSLSTSFAYGIYTSGNYAYVADAGTGLKIVNISNPASPSLVSSIVTFGVTSLQVIGNYAYTVYNTGFRVVDISNPTLPRLISTVTTTNSFAVYVSGKYAYVADGASGLRVIDISNPVSPSIISTVSTTNARGVYVSGKYAYVADGASGLRVIDISNPSAPSIISTYDTVLATAIYVSGGYVYLCDGSTIKILNVSNPASPSQSSSFSVVSSVGIYISGKYAYVADNGSNSLKVVDISSSTAPFLVGDINTTDAPFAVYVSGKYAYVAAATAGLKIIDINGIDTPSMSVGNIATNDLTVTENVDIGNNLYIKNGVNVGMGGIFSSGAVAITVSTTISTTTLFSIGTSTQSILSVMGNGYVGIGTSSPSEKLQINGGNILHTAYGNPTVIGSLGTPTVRGVYVSGKYAYGAGDSGGLRIFDVSSPAAPVLIGTASIGTAYEVAVSGKFAYVVGGASGLKIVDVSNPTSPVLVGAVSTTNAGTVFISGKYAYIADGASGLRIIDISNPTSPSIVGSVTTTNAYGVYVSGKYAYIGDLASGLRIIDISNPTSPSIVGSVTTTNAIGVYVSGKYAYVADFAGGLKIINVSNPASPTTTGSYSMSLAFRVYVSGKYAYVADENNGLKIINISNPSSPSLTGSVTLAGAYSVFVSGKYAYMGDYTSGFKIIDINGIDTPSMNVGNISTNDLTVSENVDVGNNLYIRNGLNIGLGGLLSNGAVAITVSTTISTSTLFSVGTSTANIFTIMGDGKIGIGTSTPSTTLSVVGNVGITNGALYINNNNYSQYFVNSPGTFGQLWQSNGVTGTWANTNGVVGQTLAYNANGWESSSALLTSSTTYGFEGNINPPASFVASGPSTNWTATTTGVYAGSKSLQSPPTADSSSSTLTNIVYLSNTTTISFWWKVSSEASRDYLIFCLDRPVCYANNAGYLLNNNVSTTDANITGAVAWTQVTSTVSAGLHTLRWIYLKDPNSVDGSDTGFLDDIFIGKNDDIQIQNNLTVSTQMLIGTSTFGTTGYKLTIDSGSSSGAGVGVNGYIKATGFITGTTTLDLAETYPINMLCAANGTCPTDGDVVCSDTTVIAGVKKCLGTDGDQMIGIVSANPGFLLGGGDFSNPTNIGGSVKVALAGRVPVKVSTENGIINAGDKLTLSNIDGVAAKAIGEAPVVGVAMDSYSSSEIGSIVVFVNLGWQNQLYKALTIDTNTSTLTVGSNITPYNLALSGEFTMFNDILNKLVFNATALFESKTNGTHAFIFNAVNFADSTDKYLLSLRSNDEPKFSVMSNGDIRASGNIYAASAVFGTSTNPGDLAERVDIASDDIVEPGDVLVIDMNNTDTYRRSSGSNEQAVAGVVSTNPTIVVGNGKTEYTAVMAMVGRVPLKVSDENGSISRGDLLVTASSSGYAMKYDPKKDNDDKMIGVVGVALDPFNNGKGKIMALVRTGWVNSKYETISSIKENIQQLATAQGIVLGATSTTNLSVVSNNNQLSYSGGDLNLQGNNLLNVASIVGKNNRWLIDDSGHFITKINTSQGEKDMYAIQSPTSEFVFSSSSQLMAGEAIIIFDQTMQDVIDSSQPLKINITLTSGEAKGIFVSEKNSQGFTVKELDNGVSGATFDWMVVAKRKEQSDVIPSVENTIEVNTTDTTTTTSVVDTTTTTIESVTNDESINLVSSSTPEVPVIPVNPIIDSEVITPPVETTVEVSTPIPSAEAPTLQ